MHIKHWPKRVALATVISAAGLTGVTGTGEAASPTRAPLTVDGAAILNNLLLPNPTLPDEARYGTALDFEVTVRGHKQQYPFPDEVCDKYPVRTPGGFICWGDIVNPTPDRRPNLPTQGTESAWFEVEAHHPVTLRKVKVEGFAECGTTVKTSPGGTSWEGTCKIGLKWGRV